LLLKAQKTKPTIISFGTYDFLADINLHLNRPLEQLRYADSMLVEINRINQFNPAFNTQTFSFQESCVRAIAYAGMNQPKQSLEAIHKAEALFDPQWGPKFFAIQIDHIYGVSYLLTGAYDKATEHLHRLADYHEERNLAGAPGIPYANKLLAKAYFDKGDVKRSAQIYRHVIQVNEERNRKQFYEQLNELRTIYELDKAQMEMERRQTAVRQLRTIVAALLCVSLSLAVVVMIVLWNRRRIAEKNRGLYRKIKEQDRLAEELKQMTLNYEQLALSIGQTDDPMDHEKVKLLNYKEIKHRQLVSKLQSYIRNNKNTPIALDRDAIAAALVTNRTTLSEAVS
jgi:tetratricopeptide (TPR) repeat protein